MIRRWRIGVSVGVGMGVGLEVVDIASGDVIIPWGNRSDVALGLWQRDFRRFRGRRDDNDRWGRGESRWMRV